MYLASDGKLGLGTATPDSEFHIVHNSTSGASGLPHINVEEASANDFARIKFSSSSSDFWTLAGAGGTTDKFNIFYHNGNSGTNRLSVDATEGTTILGSENTGTVAALNITSVFAGGTQTLLMDGNEIDCNDDAMHLNRNSLNKVNIRTAVERADVNLKHALGSGVDDGFAIENEAANGEFWTMYVVNSNGDLELYHQGTAVGHFDPASGTYSATSDRNRKQDIRAFNNILGKVMQLEPSVYKFKNDGKNKDYLGFIAQDIAQYFPEVVSVGKVGDTEEELYTMDYSALGVIAIEAIQEQQEVIEAQKSEIDALRAEIEAIKEIIKK